MKITYHLKIDDLLNIQKYWLKRQYLLFQRAVFALALIFAFFIMKASSSDQSSWIKIQNHAVSDIVNFAVWYAIIVVVVIWYRYSTIGRIKRQIIPTSLLLGNNSLEITSEKLIATTDAMKTEYLLGYIKRVNIERSYVIISFGKERAITIPRSTEELDQFIKELERKTNANNS